LEGMLKFVVEDYLPNYTSRTDEERRRAWFVTSAFMRNPVKQKIELDDKLRDLLQMCVDVFEKAPEREWEPLPKKKFWKSKTQVAYPDQAEFNAMLDDLHRLGCRRSSQS